MVGSSNLSRVFTLEEWLYRPKKIDVDVRLSLGACIEGVVWRQDYSKTVTMFTYAKSDDFASSLFSQKFSQYINFQTHLNKLLKLPSVKILIVTRENTFQLGETQIGIKYFLMFYT